MEKEDVCACVCVYTHICIYTHSSVSHKKEQSRTSAEMWMDLESAIQSEVGQRQKSKYHILMHIYGI